MDRLFRGRILAGGKPGGPSVRGKTQAIGLDAARAALIAGIGVNGDKQVRFSRAGDGCALLQGNKAVAGFEEDHFAARSLFDQLFELPGNGEIYVLFNAPSRTCGPRVFASMPGVQDDTPDTEPQLPRQRRHITAGNGRRRRRDPCLFLYGSVAPNVDHHAEGIGHRKDPVGRTDRTWRTTCARPGADCFTLTSFRKTSSTLLWGCTREPTVQSAKSTRMRADSWDAPAPRTSEDV